MDKRIEEILNRKLGTYIPPFYNYKHPKDMTDEEIMQLRFTWLSDEELEILVEEIDRRQALK